MVGQNLVYLDTNNKKGFILVRAVANFNINQMNLLLNGSQKSNPEKERKDANQHEVKLTNSFTNRTLMCNISLYAHAYQIIKALNQNRP